MREARMTVCRCCGQATAMAVGTGVEVDRLGWLPRAANRDEYRDGTDKPVTGLSPGGLPPDGLAAGVLEMADTMARRAGAAGASPVELLAALAASVDGGAIITRLGGDRERLIGDLELLGQVRGAAESELAPAGVREAGAAAAAALDRVVAAARRLAGEEGGETIGVRHLLAAFAAPECAAPGAALLRASLDAGVAARAAADAAPADRPVMADMEPDRAAAEPLARRAEARVGRAQRRIEDEQAGFDETAAIASAFGGIELAFASLRGELAEMAERLARLEEQAAAGRTERASLSRRAPRTVVRRRRMAQATEPLPAARTHEGAQRVAVAAAADSRSGGAAVNTMLSRSDSRRRRQRRRSARALTRRPARGLRQRFWQRITERRSRRRETAPLGGGGIRLVQNERSARHGDNPSALQDRGERRERRRATVRSARQRRAQFAAAFAEAAAGEAAEAARFYLAADDDIVEAPGIGPRTAERFREIGILTVRDLLQANAAEAARRIATRWIRPETIAAWQAQARLVCTVPHLRGTHAQLLVGAGFTTVAAMTDAEPGAVAAAILRYALTREGRSILRDGAPPEAERIEGWLLNACEAEVERVA